MKNKKNFLFLILFLLILVVIVIFIFTLSPKKKNQTASLNQTSNNRELVECTSTASDQPQTISNYKVSMFASDLDLRSYQDTGTRTFSLNALKKKTGGDDIYFMIEKSDGSYITGLRSTIEVCDENNKTSKGNSIKYVIDTPADKTATSKIKYLHGGFYPHSTGKYRIDAYAEIDGEWKLVGRLADIIITE